MPETTMLRRVLIRCDGGSLPEFGTGHVRRSLALARRLTEQGSTEIVFLMRDFPGSRDMVTTSEYQVDFFPIDGNEGETILDAVSKYDSDIALFDNLDNDPVVLKKLSDRGIVTIAMDDVGDGSVVADIAINSIRQTGVGVYDGFDYLYYPDRETKIDKSANDGFTLFISFGGFDHAGLSRRVVELITGLENVDSIQIVCGRFEVDVDSILNQSSMKGKINVHKETEAFSDLLAQSNLALVGGGLSMFHAIAKGIPSVVIAQYDHQVKNAENMEKHGCVRNMGHIANLDMDKVRAEMQRLINSPSERKKMGEIGRDLISGLGNRDVPRIAGVISKLNWDSEFFGKNIAYLHPKRLTQNILDMAFRKCKEAEIECLYYLCDCHHSKSVKLAEEHGFHFVDIRLSYGMPISSKSLERTIGGVDENPGLELRPAEPSDKNALSKIAEESYIYSRYWFDSNFSVEDCRRFYVDWINKSITGNFDDQVTIASSTDGVVGFVSCKRITANVGRIGLIGIREDMRNRGFGKYLIREAIQWALENDLRSLNVVTQGRNILAQRLYQGCGFTSTNTELWYHKWLDKPA